MTRRLLVVQRQRDQPRRGSIFGWPATALVQRPRGESLRSRRLYCRWQERPLGVVGLRTTFFIRR